MLNAINMLAFITWYIFNVQHYDIMQCNKVFVSRYSSRYMFTENMNTVMFIYTYYIHKYTQTLISPPQTTPSALACGTGTYESGPVTVEVCLGMCEADSACLSVHYWKNRQTCKLGSRTPVTHQLYADNDYDLYVPCVITMKNGRYRHRNSYQVPLIRHEHASEWHF